MKFPNDETGSILQEMFDNGEDLSKPFEISFFILFDERKEVLDYLVTRQDESCTESISWVEEEKKWELSIIVTEVPSHDAITDFEASLAEGASLFNGDIDGWACTQE